MSIHSTGKSIVALACGYVLRAKSHLQGTPEAYFDRTFGLADESSEAAHARWSNFRRDWIETYVYLETMDSNPLSIGRDVAVLLREAAGYMTSKVLMAAGVVSFGFLAAIDAEGVEAISASFVGREIDLLSQMQLVLLMATATLTMLLVAGDLAYRHRFWRRYSNGLLKSTRERRSYMRRWSQRWWQKECGVRVSSRTDWNQGEKATLNA